MRCYRWRVVSYHHIHSVVIYDFGDYLKFTSGRPNNTNWGGYISRILVGPRWLLFITAYPMPQMESSLPPSHSSGSYLWFRRLLGSLASWRPDNMLFDLLVLFYCIELRTLYTEIFDNTKLSYSKGFPVFPLCIWSTEDMRRQFLAFNRAGLWNVWKYFQCISSIFDGHIGA